MIARLSAFFFSLLFFAGCAAPKDVRLEPHEKGTIEVEMPYQAVFKNVANSAATCFPGRGNFSGYYYSTAAEIEPGKLGRVEAITSGAGVEMKLASLDVCATPTGTEIDFYISYRFFGTYDSSSSFKPVALAWASGDGSKCQ